MTEIRILDKSVFNRIAAGEVVDRPASIVKELVENAIDAGATAISISIKGGGIEMVRVSDNGHGIEMSSLRTAFMPHATSKIKTVDDLEGISTLGFRGEALPSIASVSRVTMVSRVPTSEMGARIIIDNGNEIDYGEMGAPLGTAVTVEELFGKIPARRKFLSKETTEENAITNLVARFILANGNISFKYTANGKTVYSSSGQGLESAIKTVYGNDYLSKMIKIDSTVSDIVLCGYINKPSFSKHSRSFQTLIVNGRFVENEEISYIIYGCYQKYLMKRQYPTFVLHLTLPHDLVDVNVHPNKMEVKFAIPQMIRKIIVDAIKTQVLDAVSVPKEIDDDIFSIPTASTADIPRAVEPVITRVDRAEPTSSSLATIDHKTIITPADKSATKIDSSVLNIPQTRVISSRLSEQNKAKVSSPNPAKISTITDIFSAQQPAPHEQISFGIEEKAKKVGKIFNTYIIIELGDNIFLIDQHAAHEKILYDRLVSEYENGSVTVQPMLIPYEFSLSPQESEIIDENMSILINTGFNIEKIGEKYLLKGIPLCCVGLNSRTFIVDFLSSNDDKLMPQAFKERLMQAACKAAVKGEDDLSQLEIDSLLKGMNVETTELFCPHGRPIAVKLSKRDIEKWFKRIV